MYRKEIENINSVIEKTGKAIAVFGCSWAEGQGAIPMEILENYEYVCPRPGINFDINFTNDQEKEELLKKYKDIEIYPDGNLNYHYLERKNSVVSVLCNKYFNNEYAAINFGLSGHGNKASIKQIYFYPQIHWHLIKELVVVYLPSDPARFSFVNDEFKDHFKFTTMWPHPGAQKGSRNNLWTGYANSIHSNKFSYLEAIADVNELINWANNFNHKLIIFPAFTSYAIDNFYKNILTNITRHSETLEITRNFKIENQQEINELTNIINKKWPWDNMWEPEGFPQWSSLLESNEDSKISYSDYVGKGSPKKWITPCMHPSARAHNDLAKRLHKYITTELK